jgi:hypothetical protein
LPHWRCETIVLRVCFLFLSFFLLTTERSQGAPGCRWPKTKRAADAIDITLRQLQRHNACYRVLMQCMDANLAVGDALVERIRSEALARLVVNYAGAAGATSWTDLARQQVLSTHWNNVQNVCAFSATRGFYLCF